MAWPLRTNAIWDYWLYLLCWTRGDWRFWGQPGLSWDRWTPGCSLKPSERRVATRPSLPTDFSALQLKLGLTAFFGRHIWSSASSSETFVSVQKVFLPVCSPTQQSVYKITLVVCFLSATYLLSISHTIIFVPLRIAWLCWSPLTFLLSRAESQIHFALSVLLFFFSYIYYISRVKESITGRDSVVREALEGSQLIFVLSFLMHHLLNLYILCGPEIVSAYLVHLLFYPAIGMFVICVLY